ncbi:hypothetical protein LMG27952_06668 [Paraburkholderia hiiakae]|uniref:Uncharacterized protein n=1 Tax=Paraburkholderia hiiakae TaxID=1081782 RepID=A0ABM8P7U8_9BURK|nr:hypothetical protein LMG27952_06668 [Paraburkholderia hiiakae]
MARETMEARGSIVRSGEGQTVGWIIPRGQRFERDARPVFLTKSNV